MKAVDFGDVKVSKFEQAVIALSLNHICAAVDFDDFYEEFCKCRDFLVEISNGNILGDNRAEVVVYFWKFDSIKENPNMFKLISYILSTLRLLKEVFQR
jgi:hypothetical protein